MIEAIQWTGDPEGIRDFMAASRYEFGNNILVIHTLEGDHRANPGDWIIKGVQGEFYPCKPDIFEETYEAVDD